MRHVPAGASHTELGSPTWTAETTIRVATANSSGSGRSASAARSGAAGAGTAGPARRPDASALVAAVAQLRNHPDAVTPLVRVLCRGRAGNGKHMLMRVIKTVHGPLVLAYQARAVGLRENRGPGQTLTGGWLDDLGQSLYARCQCGETAGYVSDLFSEIPADDLRAELQTLLAAGHHGVQTVHAHRAEIRMRVRSKEEVDLLRQRRA